VLLVLGSLSLGTLSEGALAANPDWEADVKRLVSQFEPTDMERTAGAVVIAYEKQIVSLGGGRVAHTTRVAIRVFDRKAVDDYSRIAISFNSFYSSINLDFAYALDSDGKKHVVRPDAVQISTRNEELIYSDVRELGFSLPALEPGTTIVYQVSERETKSPIPNGWYARLPFHYWQYGVAGRIPRLDPVRSSKIVLDFPKDEVVRAESRLAPITPTRSEYNGRIVLTWESRNLGMIPIEPGMSDASYVAPSLVVSTLKDWSDVDAWGRNIYLPGSESDQQFTALARKLRAKSDQREKIKGAFDYVKNNIRYVAADVQRGGVVPHPVQEVLKNRYGDCKDQAVLLSTILRTIGVPAYPALIARYPAPSPDRKLPNLSFNHMIVYVPDAQGDLWLDTSGASNRFPGIHWTLEGREAFVIDGRGGRLLTVPRSNAERNTAIVRSEISYVQKDLEARVRVTTTGALADSLKSRAEMDPNAEDELEKSLKSMYPSGEVLSFEILKTPSDVDVFEYRGVMRFSDKKTTGEQGSFLISGHVRTAVALFSPFMNLQSPAARRHQYLAEYTRRLILETRVSPPSEVYREISLNSGLNLDSELFAVRHRKSREDDVVVVADEFVLRSAVIGRAAYERFYGDLKTVTDSRPWVLEFRLDKQHEELSRLERELKEKQNPTVVLELAKFHMKYGEYEKAQPLIEDVLSKDADNGEAQYLLGIVQGLMGDYEASKRSIERSRELDYRPQR
jgi:transglutaminase-like putative cysteine protease